MYVKVQNHSNYMRDTTTNAVLNVDNDSLTAYKSRKEREKVVDSMVLQLNSMKKDVNEIKELLSRLIEKRETIT